MNPNFQQLYNTKLLPELEIIEKQRIENKKRNITGILLLIPIISVAFIFPDPFVFAFSFIAALVSGYIFFFRKNNSASLLTQYKEKIIGLAISELFKDVTYYPNSGINYSEFCSLGLFDQKPDRYDAEDLFEGRKEKTNFSFSEVHAEYKVESTDNKGRKTETWHDIFKGIIFVCDFNKQFEGITLVQKDTLKLWGSNNRVKLESPEFEDAFDVYSSNQQEARYLLTPKLMEQFVQLHKKFKHIELEFNYNKLYIAVPYSKNSFEMSTWRTVLNKEQVYFELNIVKELISIIDDLDLNTRVWTKE